MSTSHETPPPGAGSSRHTGAPGLGLPEPTALWNVNFIRITLISFCLFCGFQMFPAALPVWVKSLGGDDAVLGWLTAVPTVSTLILRPLAGVAMDTLGRKGVYMAGVAVMLVATVAHAFFPVVGMILFLRFVVGAGWGVASTGSGTIAADFIPKARFGEGMGFFSLAASMAMAIAPAVALSLSVDVMIWAGVGCLVLALGLSATLPYKRVAARPVEAAHSANAAAPRGKRPALYERASFVPSTVMALTTITYGATITFLAVYAAERGVGNVGPFFTTYAAVMILTRPFIGRIIDRKGFGVVVVPGALCICAALLLISQASCLVMFLGAAVLYAIGQGCVQTSSQTLAVLCAPRDRVGAANATFYTGFDLGIGIGALAGGMLAEWLGYGTSFAVLAVCPLLAGVLFLTTMRGMAPPSRS